MRLLLDAHVPLEVAPSLRARGVDAVALRHWRSGRHLFSPDQVILRAAHEEGRVLVTYDVHTIPAVLRRLAEDGTAHSGVVFVSQKTIRSDDVGALVRALERLVAQRAPTQLHNQWLFLTR